ncbi:MAG: DUF4974 domain-containing protein [Tidjanibacter sp.]|nr:DUF4974 domain-containing protein [Tidjanibacter sp.]
MNLLNDQIGGLVEAYLTDTITPAEMATLNNWVAACDENAQLFERIREVWFSMSAANRNLVFDSRKGYQKFIKRVRRAQRNSLRSKVVPFVRYAAGIAAVVALIVVSYMGGRHDVQMRFEEIVTEAPMGATTQVVLPDGSQVTLNAGSHIVYSQGFGVSDRNITLCGEGYFDVARKEDMPFVVESGHMKVEVLGTKFNMCDYADDQEASVALVEGRVDVTNLYDNIHVEITPDTRAVINNNDHSMSVTKTLANENTLWREGVLYFDEEPLADIARELERSYGVDITIESPALGGYKFYGKLPTRQLSISEVLEILASAGEVEYSIEGQHISLH